MKKLIVFINGFDGENSTKADQLNEIFKSKNLNYNAIHIKLRFNKKPDKVIVDDLDNYFAQNFKKVDLIIGTSFGGYIGRYYAHKYNKPYFALNPVTQFTGSESINKSIDFYPTLETRLQNLNSLKLNDTVFLNKDDDLIPNHLAIKNLKDSKIVKFQTGTHRFRNMEDLIPYINKVLNPEKNSKTIKINKQLILENVIINFINDLYSKYFKYFKYLDKNEFDCLINFIRTWYGTSSRISTDYFKKNTCEKKVIEKIKNNSTTSLPKKLYRGMVFKTKADKDNFLEHAKKGIILDRHDINGVKINSTLSSWTSKLDVAKEFTVGGSWAIINYKYGCICELDLNSYKDSLFFSMELLIPTNDDKREFLSKVLTKEYGNNINYINKIKNIHNVNENKMIAPQRGALFSVQEFEYILDSPDFTKITITNTDKL